MRSMILLGAALAVGATVSSVQAEMVPVTSGLVLQLDANDIDGDGTAEGAAEAGLTGTLVNTWADASGSGNDVTDTVSSAPPTVVGGGLNGLPVVRFNGTSTYLSRGDALGFTGSPAITTFVVAIDTALTNGNDDRFLQFGADGVGEDSINKMFAFSNDSSWRYNNGNRVFVNDPMIDAAGNPHIGVWRGESGDQYGEREFYLDGNTAAAQTSATNPTFTNALLNESTLVGAGFFGGDGATTNIDEYLGADIAEILVYDRTLSASEINEVGYYLQDKWGVADATFVPEPSTLCLAALGLLGLIGFGQRRRP